jgi:biotin carboxylase
MCSGAPGVRRLGSGEKNKGDRGEIYFIGAEETAMSRKNIFVLGLDPFNERLLRSVRQADDYQFHGLLDYQDVVAAKSFDVEALLDSARKQLNDFDGSIDAIVGYWDFPAISLSTILRREFGIRGPTLESVLRCEHKYWSRLRQQRAAPDVVPRFDWIDPFSDEPLKRVDVQFPCWLKPIKAHSSQLGFRLTEMSDVPPAIERIRREIHYFAEPFNQILAHAELDAQVAGIDGYKCIAEEIISADKQCTCEGYVCQGEPVVYGIVDSIRGRNGSSFERYEYPSSLPETIKQRMSEKARDVIATVGLDDAPFNIEFFHDEDEDAIHLLEINPRISKSHSPLFDKVEGVPHKEVMLDVALGKQPDFPARRGEYKVAAKCMLRAYGDLDNCHVTRVPGEDTVAQIEQAHPGCNIQLHVEPNQRLGALRHQDAYSYELGVIFLGGDNREELLRRERGIVEALSIEIEGHPESNL